MIKILIVYAIYAVVICVVLGLLGITYAAVGCVLLALLPIIKFLFSKNGLVANTMETPYSEIGNITQSKD